MIIVNQNLINDTGILHIVSDNDIQLEKEICIITDILQANMDVEVLDYIFESDYPIHRFTVFLKRDYQRNWSQLLKSLDNNLILYSKSKIYCIL